MAFTRIVCVNFVDELIAAYPEAKVMVSVHDIVNVWYDFVLDTIITNLVNQHTDKSLSTSQKENDQDFCQVLLLYHFSEGWQELVFCTT